MSPKSRRPKNRSTPKSGSRRNGSEKARAARQPLRRRAAFVSYAREDGGLVQVAVQLLQAGGADVFMDVLAIAYGERWEVVVMDRLKKSERVLVFWSAAAQRSEWVTKEWTLALSLEKKIVPCQIDETPLPKGLAQFQGIPGLLRLLQAAIELQPETIHPAPERAEPTSRFDVRKHDQSYFTKLQNLKQATELDTEAKNRFSGSKIAVDFCRAVFS